MIKRFWTGDFRQIAALLKNHSGELQKQQQQIDEQRRWWQAIGVPKRRDKDTGYFVDRKYLQRLMDAAFNNADVISLCMALGVDWENLEGENKDLKLWALIDYMERRSELYKLLDECRTRRPNYDWPLI
jgi:hypothetical protein